jgi:predicted dienelactone hydrolase
MTAKPFACAERGVHPVGVTTLEVDDAEVSGRRLAVDLWYPAEASLAGRDLEPSAGAEHPFGQPHAALENAPPAAGAFPLLAFSHGNSGLRRQSTFLTTHLASWGFVVVAPDHAGNTFPEMLLLDVEQRKAVHRAARANRPRDLAAAIAAAERGGEGLPRMAAERIGVLGHSFGGWTAAKMPAREPRVRAVCGLAPASEPFVGRRAFDDGELPFRGEVASLIVAGADDVLVDLDTSIRPLFDRLAAPRSLVAVDGMDHFHFCDGIELLHGNHQRMPREGLTRPVRALEELLPEERAHRIVRGLVTAFFLAALDGGGAALGGPLDPAVRVLA